MIESSIISTDLREVLERSESLEREMISVCNENEGGDDDIFGTAFDSSLYVYIFLYIIIKRLVN